MHFWVIFRAKNLEKHEFFSIFAGNKSQVFFKRKEIIMETEIDYSTMPRNYEVCWHRTCPMAANCLRQLAAENMTDDVRYVKSVNLRATHPETGECRDYRPIRLVRHAYGLRHIYDLVPAGIKQNLYFDIWRQLGNTMYYHYYNERRPITPREQEIIEKTFRKYGIEGPIRFRRYVEVPEW